MQYVNNQVLVSNLTREDVYETASNMTAYMLSQFGIDIKTQIYTEGYQRGYMAFITLPSDVILTASEESKLEAWEDGYRIAMFQYKKG